MKIIHAIVSVQNWGESAGLTASLKLDSNVASLFHIMGDRSYLLDANFNDKEQLEKWIAKIKSISLPTSIPAVQSIETQKIIEVIKTKTEFNLGDYHNLSEKNHFFVKIDNPHQDEKLIKLLSDSSFVSSILHVQGRCSFIAEIITDDYESYKGLLLSLKELKSIQHLETQEVISVLKYRNTILDESGNLITPPVDTREMFTL